MPSTGPVRQIKTTPSLCPLEKHLCKPSFFTQTISARELHPVCLPATAINIVASQGPPFYTHAVISEMCLHGHVGISLSLENDKFVSFDVPGPSRHKSHILLRYRTTGFEIPASRAGIPIAAAVKS